MEKEQPAGFSASKPTGIDGLSDWAQQKLVSLTHARDAAFLTPKKIAKESILSQTANLSAKLSQPLRLRRIATRYDKLAENFLAMVQLASMRLWLRAYESTP
jgi:hypothetical protein